MENDTSYFLDLIRRSHRGRFKTAINNLSPTSASEELKRICANPEGPLDTKGRGSHKVWVKRKGMHST